MKIEIHSLKNCVFCEKAKTYFNIRNIPYTETTHTKNTPEIEALMERTNQRTFPQIFIDDEFIGGYTELIEYKM